MYLHELKKGDKVILTGHRHATLTSKPPKTGLIVNVETASLFGPLCVGTVYAHEVLATVDGQRIELTEKQKKLTANVRAMGF